MGQRSTPDPHEAAHGHLVRCADSAVKCFWAGRRDGCVETPARPCCPWCGGPVVVVPRPPLKVEFAAPRKP